jgi:glycosyltransferase involved in cell wall biosynthesis
MQDDPMSSLLFVCSAKGSYTRNDVLRGVLRKLFSQYREIVSEKQSYPRRLLDVLGRWLVHRREEQWVFTGFLAQPLAPFAVLAGGRGLAMDAFISVYDTLCLDRRVIRPDGLIGTVLKEYDRWCFGRADVLLTDTEEHANFLAETFQVPRSKFTVVPVSANPEIFRPRPRPPAQNGKIRVVFYCTFLPLHGAETVYEAARLLDTERHIEIQIIGTGPASAGLDRRLESWKLENVRRVAWVDYDRLGDTLAEADICLGGHFSKNPKAQRVIPGKVYQYLAAAKPVILGDTAANRRVFTHLQDSFFCGTESADELARAIWELANNQGVRDRIARNGAILFHEKFHPDVIEEKLRRILLG